MAEQPWVPWFWADYLADTPDLSLTEHGAYCVLLAYCYLKGGRLVCGRNADASPEHGPLHRLCRCDNDQERWAVDAVLRRYFILEGNFYRHERVDKELAKRAAKKKKAQESAAAKWAKRDAARDADALRTDMRTHPDRICSEDASQSQIQRDALPAKPRPSVREGERLGQPPLPADFKEGRKGPSPKTRQAMAWIQDNLYASPAKIADMRTQDRALSRAIDICGGWSKLHARLTDAGEAPGARADFMRAFAAACSENDEAKGEAAHG